MNKLLLTFCLSLMAVSVIHAGDPLHSNVTTPLAGENYASAIHVSSAEMTTLTQTFSTQNSKSTLGGCFSKSNVQNLLNSMPSTSVFVNFRFCTDPSLLKTSLMLSGAKKESQPLSEIKCIRNGGNENSFCPTACDLTGKSIPNAINVYYFDYLELNDAYQIANPKATLGGNIDKAALQDIINSLPSSVNYISFRFCTDPQTNKTSVIFIGGSANQINNETLIVRNGKTTDSFCPTNCNRN